MVVSILTIGSISIVFKKYSENPQLSLFIYYAMYAYLNSFNAMRQFLAVSFIIVSYAELRNKRIFLFIISVFVASFIHTSALIALIVLFAPFIKTDNSLLIYTTLFITLLMGSFVNDSFFRIVSQGYFHYIEDGTFGYREQESTISALIMCILMNILFIVIYKSTDILVKKDMFFIIFFMAIIIMNITYRLELGTRIILYFTTIQTLLYPKFFNKNYVYLKWIILCYLLVVFFKILILGGGGVKNYESVILNYI